MPGSRDPNKTLATFWMHKDVAKALDAAVKREQTSRTRFILEAIAQKLGLSLDAEGNLPPGETKDPA
jgi:hypothetical protein